MKEQKEATARPGDGISATRPAERDIVLRTRDDVCSTAVELARQANHVLLLHTMNLQAAIFDQRPFLDAVRRLVLDHHDARFLILVHDGRKAIQQNNRLIELSRRLSTQIQFRRPADEHRGYYKTFLLTDRSGYLLCPLPGRYEGDAGFNNPGKVHDLRKYFMDVWEHAEPDMETRRLDL
jgi:hypothetical protein